MSKLQKLFSYGWVTLNPFCTNVPSHCNAFQNLAGIHIFKVNNGSTRTLCGICSNWTINTPERRQWLCSCVVIKFKQTSPCFWYFHWSFLNKKMAARYSLANPVEYWKALKKRNIWNSFSCLLSNCLNECKNFLKSYWLSISKTLSELCVVFRIFTSCYCICSVFCPATTYYKSGFLRWLAWLI